MNREIEILPLPALKDNYIWIIVNKNNEIILVDPGDAAPVLDIIERNHWKLSSILITHKHWDHCGGVPELIKKYPVPVFGPATLSKELIDCPVKENDKIIVKGFGELFTVIAIPGHTLEHIAYYGQGALFCGDILFTAGCGRLFEGTPAQMYESLQKLAALPDDTLIYCGHEYTLSNLKFAKTLEPDNQALIKRMEETEALRARNLPTVPASLKIEKETNPFLRCEVPAIIRTVQMQSNKKSDDPIEIFAEMRRLKDNFRA